MGPSSTNMEALLEARRIAASTTVWPQTEISSNPDETSMRSKCNISSSAMRYLMRLDEIGRDFMRLDEIFAGVTNSSPVDGSTAALPTHAYQIANAVRAG